MNIKAIRVIRQFSLKGIMYRIDCIYKGKLISIDCDEDHLDKGLSQLKDKINYKNDGFDEIPLFPGISGIFCPSVEAIILDEY